MKKLTLIICTLCVICSNSVFGLSNVLVGRPIIYVADEWNPAANVNDDDASTSWANNGFPAIIEFDLEQSYSLSALEMVPYQGRDYQFILEAKENLGDAYAMALDASGNTNGGSLISKTFPEVTGRYVRLTVTGAAT